MPAHRAKGATKALLYAAFGASAWRALSALLHHRLAFTEAPGHRLGGGDALDRTRRRAEERSGVHTEAALQLLASSEACCLVPRPLYRPHARRNVLDRSIGYMGRKFRRQNGQEWPILTPSGAAARRSAGLNWESPWGHFRPRVRLQRPPGYVGPGIRRRAVAKQAPSCSTYSVCTSSRNIRDCCAQQRF
jgi:hypothetical protein